MRRLAWLMLGVWSVGARAAEPTRRPSADGLKAANAAVMDRVRADDVRGLLDEVGVETEQLTDPVGDPLLRGRHAGAPFLVLFFDCDGEIGCRAVQFRGYVPRGPGVPEAAVAAWNRSARGGRAWIDEEGDPTLTWAVRLHGGVTPGHLRQERDGFLSAYAVFRRLLSMPVGEER